MMRARPSREKQKNLGKLLSEQNRMSVLKPAWADSFDLHDVSQEID